VRSVLRIANPRLRETGRRTAWILSCIMMRNSLAQEPERQEICEQVLLHMRLEREKVAGS